MFKLRLLPGGRRPLVLVMLMVLLLLLLEQLVLLRKRRRRRQWRRRRILVLVLQLQLPLGCRRLGVMGHCGVVVTGLSSGRHRGRVIATSTAATGGGVTIAA